MDFGLLPPEVNSGRMYAGPGPGPMLAAAAAWDGVAAELHTVAAAYESSAAELGAGWHGPSSTAMAAAAAPYTQWLHTTAAQAEQSAVQGRAAAAAYEAAFTATVPPPLIEANRDLLMTLIATNFLGQNTPSIAATEAHYAEMWAQDATAMYAYAGSTATATQLVPFAQPPLTTNPARTALPHAAASMSGVHDGMSAFNSAFGDLFGAYSLLGFAGIGGGWFLTASNILTVSQNISPIASLLSGPKPITGALAPLSGHLLSTPALSPAGLAGGVSGAMSRAGMVGGLSVPPAWTSAAPAATTVAATAPVSAAAGAAPAFATGTQAGLLGGGMGLSGLAGRAMAASATQSAAAGNRTTGTAAQCVESTTANGPGGTDNTVTILVIPPPE